MAAHRISARRVLELDVPLTWQEAVAIAHEAVIVSLVHEARNGTPARMDVDACILTRGRDVALVMERSNIGGKTWAHVFVKVEVGLTSEKDVSGWIEGRFLVTPATPNDRTSPPFE